MKKIIQQKDKIIQSERNAHGWEKKGGGNPITLEDNLRAEITRLSRGYQQVLERLENSSQVATTVARAANHSPRRDEDKDGGGREIVTSVTGKASRPSSGNGKSPRNSGISQQNRPKSAGTSRTQTSITSTTSTSKNNDGTVREILVFFVDLFF